MYPYTLYMYIYMHMDVQNPVWVKESSLCLASMFKSFMVDVLVTKPH